jgi:hypothetical protein
MRSEMSTAVLDIFHQKNRRILQLLRLALVLRFDPIHMQTFSAPSIITAAPDGHCFFIR